MIAVVTAHGVAEIDVDHPILTAALTPSAFPRHGVLGRSPRSTGPRSSRDDPLDLGLLATRVDDYVEWAEERPRLTRLLNPVEVIRWNVDKRYLDDLVAAGFPTTPTTFVEPGLRPGPSPLPPRIPVDGGLVVKPVVSAGANDTARHTDVDAAHVDRLHDGVARR
jgi:hypothetical protein